MSRNILGLDKKESKNLGVKLNGLFENFQINYQNLRGLDWNIKEENI
jgi:hypothetical protein